MACYIIVYSGTKSGSWLALKNTIKSYGTWAHITNSSWAVVTDKKATEIRNGLLPHVPTGGRLIVVKSGIEAAWRNVICSNEWLKKHL